MNLNTEAKVLDPKNETIECNFFDLQIGRKIENLFLLQSVLLVVSKTSMYEVDLSNCPSEVSFDLIFNNKTHAETERVIKDAEYMKRHQSVYLMIGTSGTWTPSFANTTSTERATKRCWSTEWT